MPDAPNPYPPDSPLHAWAERVRASLGDAFVVRDPDGLERLPLYGPESDRPVPDPGKAPFVRGFSARPGGATAFSYREPGASDLAAALAEDAPLGLDVAWVPLDPDVAAGLVPSGDLPPLEAGLVPGEGSLAALAAAAGSAKVAVEAGAAAAALCGAVGNTPLELRADPVMACLAAGRLPDDPRRIFGRIAAAVAGHGVGRFAYLVDGARFAEAGAPPALELAATVAAAVETVGAAGTEHPLVVRVSAGTFVLDEIAKIRALRPLLVRALGPAGIDPGALRIEVRMSRRVLAATDVWPNLLRGTLAAVAGLGAGASAVGVEALDGARGLPGPLGRRLARNTVTILREEAHFGRSVDPFAGGYAMERHTAELLATAWRKLQGIAREGGLWAYAAAGRLAADLAAARTDAAAAVASGDRPLVGVTLHPDPELARPADARPAAGAIRSARGSAHARTLAERVAEDLGTTSEVPAVQLERLAAPHEPAAPGKEAP